MRYLILFSVLVFFIGCLFISSCSSKQNKLSAGKWRGTVELENATVPFEFEVEPRNQQLLVTLINGKERITLSSVEITNDSVIMHVGLYDAVLKGSLDEKEIKGNIFKAGVKGPAFKAQFKGGPRFFIDKSSKPASIEGTWAVQLVSESRERSGVLLFKQDGHQLTGSLLTPTGDYRFFEGVADGNQFRLSTFGGAYPYLIRGKVDENGQLKGEFISGGGITQISGILDPDAKLPDTYGKTYLKDGAEKFHFTFPNLQGDSVSLSDPKYDNKVVLVSIMGSWCPNCIDEMAFLSPWYQQNKDRGVEIIALAFERKNTLEYARKVIRPLIDRYDVEYDVLLAGKIGGDSAEEALPQLNAVLSFPTTIYINREGEVRYIHSGFSGPATGKFHDELIADFNAKMDELLGE
ncbi:TlpA disulfide reductase family protein [Marinilabilia rubra]|uniref:TlpA family protein disulfide reductase n=1 Tax=Marinilabilia rubra TaxID=2162893 RepID=A0A2U2B7V8_9BACT|nr:TlpA disulfide reductase family protein [Marinilabilia rubra]PWD99147.1 TlpA family protein disulfide reductase [Marinilabilia rubra]